MTQQKGYNLDAVIHTAESLERGRSFEDTGNISMSQLNGFFNRILYKYQPTIKGKTLLASNGIDVNRTERLLEKLKNKKIENENQEKEGKLTEKSQKDADVHTKSIYPLIDKQNDLSILSNWGAIKDRTIQNQMNLLIYKDEKESYLSKINFTKSIFDNKELEHYRHSFVVQEAINTLCYARSVCKKNNIDRPIDTCNSLMGWNDSLWKKLKDYERKYIPVSSDYKIDASQDSSLSSLNSPSPGNSPVPEGSPSLRLSEEERQKALEEERQKNREIEAEEKKLEEIFAGIQNEEYNWERTLNFEYFFLLSTLIEDGKEKTNQFRRSVLFLQRQYRYKLFGSYAPSSNTIEQVLEGLPPMKRMWKLFRSGLFTKEPFCQGDRKSDVYKIAESLSDWIEKANSDNAATVYDDGINNSPLSEVRSTDEITSSFIEIISNTEVTQPASLLETVEDTVFLALLRFVVEQRDVDQSLQVVDMQKTILDELAKVKHENKPFEIVEPMVLIELGLYSEAVDALIECGYSPAATVHIVYVILQLCGSEVGVETRMKTRFQRIVWDFVHMLPRVAVVDDAVDGGEIDCVQIAAKYLLLCPNVEQLVDFVIENGREGHQVDFLMQDFKGDEESTRKVGPPMPEREAYDKIKEWVNEARFTEPRKVVEILAMLHDGFLPELCVQVSNFQNFPPSDIVACARAIAANIDAYDPSIMPEENAGDQRMIVVSTLKTCARGLMVADRLEPEDRYDLIASVHKVASYVEGSREAEPVLRLARLAQILDAWDRGDCEEMEAIADELLPTGPGDAYKCVRAMRVPGLEGAMPVECGLRAILYFAEHNLEENRERISGIDRFCQFQHLTPEYDERLMEIRSRLKL